MAAHVVSITHNTLRAKSVTEAKGQDCVAWPSLIKCLDNSAEKIMYEYKSSCVSRSYSESEMTAKVRLMGPPSTQHPKSALSLPISFLTPLARLGFIWNAVCIPSLVFMFTRDCEL